MCVSDLHLGKSERIARRGGSALPPYETRDTLTRLAADLALTKARTVICLGDSFDDLAAAEALPEEERLWIARLQAGRRWIWIEGNHDPGPVDLGGSTSGRTAAGAADLSPHRACTGTAARFRATTTPRPALHARGRSITRPAFL